MEWIQWSYLRVCLLQLYAYEYKCVTDLGPISLTGLLAPFAVHVHCHMIAYMSNVTVIDNVCCIQKDLRHQLLYYCWRPPRRSDAIRKMFFFISCDIEYSFSVTHVYLLFGVIYAMTCMYIYGNKAFWNWKIEIVLIQYETKTAEAGDEEYLHCSKFMHGFANHVPGSTCVTS